MISMEKKLYKFTWKTGRKQIKTCIIISFPLHVFKAKKRHWIDGWSVNLVKIEVADT